ncbi:hypothetical protein KIN20_009064 [Parelaphostrongylus tenuis]|uniref:Uncharacterized protein n=1 Tax=Parelaphostrongylus tenuis TaxID=148309 RepID=A0AAD5QI07_PARTN|nr:hypothetical protein KIN20_009064 [Parelaphostrongylus tenuis]
MWGCGFHEHDEDSREIAVMKRQFLDEPAPNSFAFPQPPLGLQAKDFVATHFGKDAKNMQFRKGTTTLALSMNRQRPMTRVVLLSLWILAHPLENIYV